MEIENEVLTAPVLQPEITEKNYERAVTGSSGACIAADAIKKDYPQFSRVDVDAATIRVTDKERGVRYTYLTPPAVQEALYMFDQGIRETALPKKLVIKQVVKITPIIRSVANLKLRTQQRAARIAELEAKEKGGELTSDEKRNLSKLRTRKEPPARPTSYGKPKDVGTDKQPVILGGAPEMSARKRKQNPNLLAGRNRIFCMKSAKPHEVYRKQLETEVASEVAKARAEIKAEYEAELARLKKRKSK